MNPSRQVFEDHAKDYDRWFDEHDDTYQAQLRMLRNALPDHGHGLEVGIGSGRFAVPLGIGYGIDPSHELLKMAKSRGTEVVLGEGEHLPYCTGSFDYVLMMTVICFLEDVIAVFHEANRVLSPGGILVVGFIEKEGEVQRIHKNRATKGKFLRFAKFRTAGEAAGFFRDAGFARVSVIERTRGFCIIKGQRA